MTIHDICRYKNQSSFEEHLKSSSRSTLFTTHFDRSKSYLLITFIRTSKEE